MNAARRATNEQLSIRIPSSGGGPGFRAYRPLNQGNGVTVVIEGGKITNAWPTALEKIAEYLL